MSPGLVKVFGLANVLRRLEQSEQKVEKGVARGIIRGALRIEADAKDAAPVDTGNLKASGFTVFSGGSSGVGSSAPGRDALGRFLRKVDTITDDDVRQTTAKAKQDASIDTAASRDPIAIVGFGARYAPVVHKNHSTRSQFLSNSMRSNRDRVRRFITEEVHDELG